MIYVEWFYFFLEYLIRVWLKLDDKMYRCIEHTEPNKYVTNSHETWDILIYIMNIRPMSMKKFYCCDRTISFQRYYLLMKFEIQSGFVTVCERWQYFWRFNYFFQSNAIKSLSLLTDNYFDILQNCIYICVLNSVTCLSPLGIVFVQQTKNKNYALQSMSTTTTNSNNFKRSEPLNKFLIYKRLNQYSSRLTSFIVTSKA